MDGLAVAERVIVSVGDTVPVTVLVRERGWFDAKNLVAADASVLGDAADAPLLDGAPPASSPSINEAAPAALPPPV